MSNIKLTTLSAVHVGSGNFLQYNTDFVEGKEDGQSFLYVIDPNKIFGLIGEEHLNDWIVAIERKSDTKDFVGKFSPRSIPDDYSSRYITNFVSTLHDSETLKECIHNGMGLPYIPGSSIKGAIRTAVLSTMASSIEGKEEKIDKTRRNGNPILGNNGRITIKSDAKKIESELFGENPNTDIFRFIQIGDAYFEKGCEIATKMVNLNITHKDTLIDKTKSQIVEAIGIDYESEFQLKIALEYYQMAKSKDDRIGVLPDDIQNIKSLFHLINQHTKQLVDNEIEYWDNVNISGAENYLDNLKNLLDEINNCVDGKECVLRIGHASGWRFITGAWTEQLENFEDVVVPASRPRNDYYQEYDFPKSRRLDVDGDVFGFVKLSL